jgi:DNA primase
MKLQLTTLLESVLGKGKSTSGDNVAYFCPFCHHHKRKLEVNHSTQHFNCWTCNIAGRKLITLFRKLNVNRERISQLFTILNETEYRPNKTTTNTPVVELPKEFKPLWILDANNPEYRNAAAYLKRRNVTITDILKYRIGYCSDGKYSGKIIVPSYDANGSLNYFVARAYYESDARRYQNPNVCKDIIGFELHINWSLPIVLVEGVFDAIAVKRNAIPLFGKTISNTLKKRIVEKRVKEIYICLDRDARRQALETAKYFMAHGIDVYFVDLNEKDPSQIGFEMIISYINKTSRLSEERLMEENILCLL